MRAKLPGVLVALVLLAGGAAACGNRSDTEAASGGAKIVIGSFGSTESQVLARIYGGALEAAGATVDYRLGIANAEAVAPALENGEIDLVPAYLGYFLGLLDPTQTKGMSTPQAVEALEAAAARRGLTVAEASPGANSEVIAVTKDFATTNGLKRISDLQTLPPPISLAGPIDCATRETCLVGLRTVYGLDAALTLTGMDEGGQLTKEALQAGTAQIGRLSSSDPDTAKGGKYVVLEDDKVFQQPGNIVPVLRRDKATSALLDVVNKVSEALTTEKLAEMNEKATEDSEAPAAIADSFLGTENL